MDIVIAVIIGFLIIAGIIALVVIPEDIIEKYYDKKYPPEEADKIKKIHKIKECMKMGLDYKPPISNHSSGKCRCAYCGTAHEANDTNCKNCGAPL